MKFCGIETRKYKRHYIYESMLQKYQLEDEKTFNEFHNVLKKAYEAHQ